jgi:hypothetical protein
VGRIEELDIEDDEMKPFRLSEGFFNEKVPAETVAVNRSGANSRKS